MYLQWRALFAPFSDKRGNGRTILMRKIAMVDDAAVRLVRPALTREPDFFHFWRESLREIDELEIDVKVHAVEAGNNELKLQWIDFRSLSATAVRGYLVQRVGDDRPRPLLVYTHGYAGQCRVMWRWARAGLDVMGFDVRGFGRSRDAVSSLSPHGYVLTGIHSPHSSILRGAVADFIQASRVARGLLDHPVSRVIFFGKSFGGALAAMASTMAKSDLLACGVPSLSWAQGRRLYAKAGSSGEINAYLHRNPDEQARVMKTLSYFDIMNFAGRIQCPTLVGVGMEDEIVPASTVYAFINHLQCQFKVCEFPYSHSQRPEERQWIRFDRAWLALAVCGTGGEGNPAMKS